MVYDETAAVALVYNRMNVAAAVALCASACIHGQTCCHNSGDSVWTTGVDVK